MIVDDGLQRRCVCHIRDVQDEEIFALTDRQWDRLCEFVTFWRNLPGIYHDFAIRFDTDTARSEGFHRRCFVSFTDKLKLERARLEMLLGDNKPKDKSSECIICGVQKKSKKAWKVEKLCCCKSSANGTSLIGLRRAAQKLGDQQMLELFRRHDSEPDFKLRYHHDCYSKYCKRKSLTVGDGLPIHDAAFNEFFRDVVDKRIIIGNEIVPRSELIWLFMAQVETTEGINASDWPYNSWSSRVEKQIRKQYGDGIRFITVSGHLSHFAVSSTRLKGIVANANSDSNLSMQQYGAEVILEHSPVEGASSTAVQFNAEADMLYRCIGCRKSFETVADLEAHKNLNVSCSNQYQNIIEHARTLGVDLSNITSVPNVLRYRCEHCFKCFNVLKSLEKHVELMHAGTKRNFPELLFRCKLCSTEKWFLHQKKLNKHMHDIHDSRPHLRNCKRCHKNVSDLTAHRCVLRRFRPYLCQYCNKRCGKATQLKTHTMRHLRRLSKEKVYYQCEHCSKQFRSSLGLVQHLVIHSNGKPYCCETCGKQFLRAQHFERHRQIHDNDDNTDVKWFLCEFCSATFRTRASLRKHTACIHTIVRPYMCPDCGRGYITAWFLKTHVQRSHSGVKPHVCQVCSKTFGSNQHL